MTPLQYVDLLVFLLGPRLPLALVVRLGLALVAEPFGGFGLWMLLAPTLGGGGSHRRDYTCAGVSFDHASITRRPMVPWAAPRNGIGVVSNPSSQVSQDSLSR